MASALPVQDLLARLVEVSDGYLPPSIKERAIKLLKDATAAAIPSADEAASEGKARQLYLRGRMLGTDAEYSAEAEELLSRSLKAEPSNWDAWLGLGKTLFKKGDMEAARNAFEKAASTAAAAAVEQPALSSKLAAAKRSLSIVVRQIRSAAVPVSEGFPGAGTAAAAAVDAAAGSGSNGGAGARMASKVQVSLHAAKEAVAADMSEPDNWMVLGTASLSFFFANPTQAEELMKALKCYQKAADLEASLLAKQGGQTAETAVLSSEEEVEGYLATLLAPAAAAAAGGVSPAYTPRRFASPDLHFNRAVALSFSLDWAEALQSFSVAEKLDRSLPCKDMRERLQADLPKIAGVLQKKGYAKPKALKELSAGLLAPPARAVKAAIQTAVGPARKLLQLSELKEGSNAGGYVQLKPVFPVARGDEPPAMFVAMDSKEEVVAVATYTLTETDISRLTDKTLITIMDPVVKTVSLERHAAAAAAAEGGAAAAAGGAGGAAAGTASFRCLHVLNASRMLINARSTDQVAFKPSLSVTAFQG